MKALIINSQGKTDEAFELCKVALQKSMKSHITWHVYGLLYRSVKNYEEAIKAYKFALRLDPESQQIQRDLALLQVHIRDYQGYVHSRQAMLQSRPGIRQNWTAMAIAHHLVGDYKAAEAILTAYEDTLKQPPPQSDVEHSGATLYKNYIIAQSGETQRALDHLETIYKRHPDRSSVMEMKAKYLLALGRGPEAERAYRKLLGRNMECRAYYSGLEQALNLSQSISDDHGKLKDLYKSFADKSERLDAPRRIPLDFLNGSEFREAADAYLRRMLQKGVHATFANIKALYRDAAKKEAIISLVHGYEQETAGSTNGDNVDNFRLIVLYFLAQHYDYHMSRDLAKAMDYVEKCIILNSNPKENIYMMTKARIQKYGQDLTSAASTMDLARQMDLKDRYICNKFAKYQLRNNLNTEALTTMGLFTRPGAIGGPLGDLLDTQCCWFLYEDGQAHLRNKNRPMGLKRLRQITDIFDQMHEDQFDFHSFSLRKGQIISYIEMIQWEDKLRQHTFYSRAAISASKVYCELYDESQQTSNNATNGTTPEHDAAEKKKAAKKARKEAEKQEAEAKAKLAAKSEPTKEAEESVRKDNDPMGLELVKTKDPLAEAIKLIMPLIELAGEDVTTHEIAFEVFLRKRKSFFLFFSFHFTFYFTNAFSWDRETSSDAQGFDCNGTTIRDKGEDYGL